MPNKITPPAIENAPMLTPMPLRMALPSQREVSMMTPIATGRLKADALLLRPAATLGETQEQGEISQGIEQCHHGGDELDD